LRDLAKVKSWLFTTLYREFLRGRRRGERVTSLDAATAEGAEPAAVEVDTVSAMDAGVVMTALQEVDEVFRAPLTLFYLQDLSYQEIADALDVPIGTVMSRLSRGKSQLRGRLSAKASGTNVIPFSGFKTKERHG
jgi:RNA polymerase sigma-70 factor (ECF subfamily)